MAQASTFKRFWVKLRNLSGFFKILTDNGEIVDMDEIKVNWKEFLQDIYRLERLKLFTRAPRMNYYLRSSYDDINLQDDQDDDHEAAGPTANQPLKSQGGYIQIEQSGNVKKKATNEATKIAKKGSAKSQTASIFSRKKAAVQEISELFDDDHDEVDEPAEGNMKTIMSLLGMDYDKSVQAKRQKLDKYTDDVIEKHQTKLQKIMNAQLDARKLLLEDLRRNSTEVLEQWEKDLKSLKDQESKLMKQYEQHMKTTQQVINQENQRAASLRKIQSAYAKAQQDLEEKHKAETCSMTAELRKEMEKVHKKLCQEKAQQALANARKSLLQDI